MLRTARRDNCRGLAEHSVDVVLDVRTKRREGVAATQSSIPRPRTATSLCSRVACDLDRVKGRILPCTASPEPDAHRRR